ncbi:hypothetical protein V8E53_014364 [Lactarius tabidus]
MTGTQYGAQSPQSTRSKKRAGADAPPEILAPTPPACSVPPLMLTAGDPLYGFLAKVPSPVTLPLSYYTSARTGAPPPAAQPVAARTPTPRDDPYAFLEKVPSLVTLPQLPPSHHGEGYTMPTCTASSHSGPAVSPVPLASPACSNPAFGLTAAVPSTWPQTPTCDESERITVSDLLSPSPSHDPDIVMELSAQPSVISLPESSDTGEHDLHARNAALLVCRLSCTPPINQINAHCVPIGWEERLNAAREIIDIQLDELADFRKELSRLNDQALQHIIVLANPQDEIDRITVSDSSLPVYIQEISTPEDVLTFPKSGVTAVYAQVDAHTVSLTLDERLHKAEDVIAQALDNLETFSVKEYLHP